MMKNHQNYDYLYDSFLYKSIFCVWGRVNKTNTLLKDDARKYETWKHSAKQRNDNKQKLITFKYSNIYSYDFYFPKKKKNQFWEIETYRYSNNAVYLSQSDAMLM